MSRTAGALHRSKKSSSTVPGESGLERTARLHAGLIKAVARARSWYERLLSADATSVRAIARNEGVTPRYVGRLLRCAFLAPQVIEAILHGHQPPHLMLAQLCQNLPLGWTDQHHALGMQKQGDV